MEKLKNGAGSISLQHRFFGGLYKFHYSEVKGSKAMIRALLMARVNCR
jgi:hypothetical protein